MVRVCGSVTGVDGFWARVVLPIMAMMRMRGLRMCLRGVM